MTLEERFYPKDKKGIFEKTITGDAQRIQIAYTRFMKTMLEHYPTLEIISCISAPSKSYEYLTDMLILYKIS